MRSRIPVIVVLVFTLGIVSGCASPARLHAPRPAPAPLFEKPFETRGSVGLTRMGPEITAAASLPYGLLGFVSAGFSGTDVFTRARRTRDIEYGAGVYVPANSRFGMEVLIGRGHGLRYGTGRYRYTFEEGCVPTEADGFCRRPCFLECSVDYYVETAPYAAEAMATWHFGQLNLWLRALGDDRTRLAFLLRWSEVRLDGEGLDTELFEVESTLEGRFIEPTMMVRTAISRRIDVQFALGYSQPTDRLRWGPITHQRTSMSLGLVMGL